MTDSTEEPRAGEMTADEATELVLKRPGMYGLVPLGEHRSVKAERDAALAAIERCRGVITSWKSVQASNREQFESGNPGMIVPIDCVGGLSAALDEAPEPEPVTVHNFRWKYPSGRVSWTYRTREAAMKFLRHAPDGVELECSADDGKTWLPVEGDSKL